MRSLMIVLVMVAVVGMAACGGAPSDEQMTEPKADSTEVFEDDFEEGEAAEWVDEEQEKAIETADFEDGTEPKTPETPVDPQG